eukprot:Mycagemm_TRINITY_DN10287_c1_g5::TRINITY_DN10287_c1_g5_i2::g.3728::m.3728 type:complete len:112 gc:universal TRINITY_DN10287_c1_g5_i2:940-1275(+)
MPLSLTTAHALRNLSVSASNLVPNSTSVRLAGFLTASVTNVPMSEKTSEKGLLLATSPKKLHMSEENCSIESALRPNLSNSFLVSSHAVLRGVRSKSETAAPALRLPLVAA